MKSVILLITLLLLTAIAATFLSDTWTSTNSQHIARYSAATEPVTYRTQGWSTASTVDLSPTIIQQLPAAEQARSYGDGVDSYLALVHRGEPWWDCSLHHIDTTTLTHTKLKTADHKIGGCWDVYTDGHGTWYAVDPGYVNAPGDTYIYQLIHDQAVPIEGLAKLQGLHLFYEPSSERWFGRSATVHTTDGPIVHSWHVIEFPPLTQPRNEPATPAPNFADSSVTETARTDLSSTTPEGTQTAPESAPVPPAETSYVFPETVDPAAGTFLTKATVTALLAEETAPFTSAPDNPTMEQTPQLSVRSPNGQFVYYPSGTTWYQERFSGNSSSSVTHTGYSEVVRLINQTKNVSTLGEYGLRAVYGERGRAATYSGLIKNDDAVQLVSYHTTLRVGSKFINSYDYDNFKPLEPYYQDTWVFISEPFMAKMLAHSSTTGARDTPNVIPVPPPYHTDDDDFTFDVTIEPKLKIENNKFTIANYGVQGLIPSQATVETDRATPSSVTTDEMPLLALTIPTSAIPDTSYRGTTINLYAVTDQETIDTYCSYRSSLQPSNVRVLGEREFGIHETSEGAAGSQYDTILATSYAGDGGTCFIIELTTRSSVVPTATDNHPVPFPQSALDDILNQFLDSLSFQS